MHVLLYLKSHPFLLHLHADDDVKVFSLFTGFLVPHTILVKFGCISILHIVSGMMPVGFLIHAGSYEVVIKFAKLVIFSLQINHWTGFPFLVDKKKTGNISFSRNFGIICTEGGSNMYNARTIFCGHIITGNYTKSLTFHLNEAISSILTRKYLISMLLRILLNKSSCQIIYFFAWLDPRHELGIMQAHKLAPFVTTNNLERYYFFLLVEIRKLTLFYLLFRIEIGTHTTLGHD